MLPSIEQRLAQELSAKPAQVAAAIALMDEGATKSLFRGRGLEPLRIM